MVSHGGDTESKVYSLFRTARNVADKIGSHFFLVHDFIIIFLFFPRHLREKKPDGGERMYRTDDVDIPHVHYVSMVTWMVTDVEFMLIMDGRPISKTRP